ncbi:Kinesin-like_protein [Hexamita inflata]|uniref:Kinesin-like protein n=1 Tax=Hexamita inflata TaxID=28002 RepID=A0AA86PAF9_9EUKA|nr:Kinesin-like protein [Hexamita inflata]
MSDNIQVLVRVRPLIDREKNDKICINLNDNSLVMKETTGNELFDQYATDYSFAFDKIAHPDSTQEDVFDQARSLIDSFISGYNSSIMAYGLTSSGKTYTMFSCDDDNLGIVPRATQYICDQLDSLVQQKKLSKYSLSFSFVQIYNEQLSDLLNPTQQLKIRITDQPEIENMSQYLIKSYQDVIQLIQHGEMNRKTSQTRYNELSSRSHVISSFFLETNNTVSKLNLVDLAGSEKLSSAMQSTQGQETKYINTSLSTLNKVIYALSEHKQHIPYRDSVLTKLLSDSLGGNYLSLLICCVSPASSSFFETLNSLRFAERAKRVVNKAVKNEIQNDSPDIVEKLEQEISRLEGILENKHSGEQISVLKQQIFDLQQTLNFGGLVEFSSTELKTLQIELDRKKSLPSLDFNNSLDKFQLVLQKQESNLEYLLQKINQQNNYLNQLLVEFELTQRQKIQLGQKLQRLQFKMIKNDCGKPIGVEKLGESDKIGVLEGELNGLERKNQILKAKIAKGKEYIKQMKQMDGTELEKKILKEMKLKNLKGDKKEKMNKYQRESHALVNIMKNKIEIVLENNNIDGADKFCTGALEALKRTRNDYE